MSNPFTKFGHQLGSNPFLPLGRNFNNLHARRILLISRDDDARLLSRPVHPSQTHLPDVQLQCCPCVFSDDFALVTHDFLAEDEFVDPWNGFGTVGAIVHCIVASEASALLPVACTETEEAAHHLIQNLSFQNGSHSRCWEISSDHLEKSSLQFLESMADDGAPTGLLFEVFRVPASQAVGVKLIATPWSDVHLQSAEGIDAVELLNEHMDAEMPFEFLKVLHLAARADTRILIFDPEAPVLNGLPLFDH